MGHRVVIFEEHEKPGGTPMDLTGKKVVLIGGGNVAMDAARTAVRLDAETIHVFTRKRDDILNP
jgi:NADPH-dependent glutamate synthase beta subunit-like oxidoreductase